MKPLIACAVTVSVMAFGSVHAENSLVGQEELPEQVASEDALTNNNEIIQEQIEEEVHSATSPVDGALQRSEERPAPDPASIKRASESTPVAVKSGSILDDAIRIAASRHNVSSYILGRIAYCETNNRNIQSQIINAYGVQENSWGYFQIHLDSHPEVSVEQALDPYFAADWAAIRVAKGEIWRWYGYNSQLDRCN